MTTFNRRAVLMTSGLALAHGSLSLVRGEAEAAGAAASHRPAWARPAPTVAASDVLPSFPSTDPERVSGVVGASHTDLDRVVELVTAHPHLARASVDWGFGDWETALGAAAHMGRHDIAEFLLANGARPNIFSAAMLGQLAVVHAFVEAYPGVQRIPGPHGLTLLHHARAGGEAAAPVFDYLEGLGDADLQPETVELSDEQKQRLLGSYDFEADSRASLEITDIRGTLSLQREGAPFGRRMFPVSETEFFPSGSPSVRIAFEVRENAATGLRITDSEVILEATRRAG